MLSTTFVPKLPLIEYVWDKHTMLMMSRLAPHIK